MVCTDVRFFTSLMCTTILGGPSDLTGRPACRSQTQTNRGWREILPSHPRSDATYSVAVQENGTTITLPFPGTIEQSGMGIRLDANKGKRQLSDQ
jgi:hypothetical protein